MANGDTKTGGLSSIFGGMIKKGAVEPIKGRKKRLDEEEEKTQLMPEAPPPAPVQKVDNYPWD